MPGCEGHRWHCIWKGFRPRIKTPVPGIRIRIGGRSQYNIGLHFVLFVVGLPQFREGGQSFSFGGHCPPLCPSLATGLRVPACGCGCCDRTDRRRYHFQHPCASPLVLLRIFQVGPLGLSPSRCGCCVGPAYL